MFNKKLLNCIIALTGILIFIFGFYLMNNDVNKGLTGTLFGIGSGLFGVGLANIFTLFYSQKNPEKAKWKEIQVNDERNKILKYKTGSTICTVNLYIICALMVISSILEAPIWIKFSLIGIIVLDAILYIIIFNIYNKNI